MLLCLKRSMRFKLKMNWCARNIEVIESLTRAIGWSSGNKYLTAWVPERLGEELEDTEKLHLSRRLTVRGPEKWANSWGKLRGQGRVLFLQMGEVRTCLLIECSVNREGRSEGILQNVSITCGSLCVSTAVS